MSEVVEKKVFQWIKDYFHMGTELGLTLYDY